MFIKHSSVQGFKSLADVKLADLAAVNILHGFNDVGKSNILQAIDLYLRLLPQAIRSLNEPEDTLSLKPSDLQPHKEAIFRQPGQQEIVWQADLQLPGDDQLVSPRLTLTGENGDDGELILRLDWNGSPPPDEVKRQLVDESANGFNQVDARRRLTAQWFSSETPPIEYNGDGLYSSVVQPDNLRQALLDAAFGQDRARRKRFGMLASLLNEHFGIGELETALGNRRPLPRARPDEPTLYGQEIILWLSRPDFPEPLRAEDVGSGVRQLILLLAQLLFNPARIAGIEEPEMNLNPEWQTRLLALLRDLIGPEAGQFDQFFISSHSPEFEVAEHFYNVTYTDGQTRVQKLPLPQRERYFAHPAYGEQMGPYLNSLNQVTLPQRVIDDLGLRRREPVFFHQTAGGYWRLRTKAESLALMEAGEEYDVEPDTGDADSAG